MPTPKTRSVWGSKKKLGHAFRAVDRNGAARSGPGKFGNLDLAVLFLRLRLGQTAPGNFGIGENHRGNCIGLEGNFVAGDGFGGGASFMRSLVRKHGLTDYIADGVDRGIVGLELLVDLDESALAEA